MNLIINVIVILGLVSPLLIPLINFIKLKAKNERVQLALTFAIQVVESIGQANRYLPDGKKMDAITMLNQRLEQNGIAHKFTVEQLEAYINQAKEVK